MKFANLTKFYENVQKNFQQINDYYRYCKSKLYVVFLTVKFWCTCSNDKNMKWERDYLSKI